MEDCWDVFSASPEQTRWIGALIGRCAEAGTVLLLAGDLGSGKTCLTQGLGAGLELAADEPVTSPSYTLMNHYRGRLDLYHFDLYRLQQLDDLEDLGFTDYLYGGGVVVVEWSQRFPDLQPEGLYLSMDREGGDEERRLRFSARGRPAKNLLQRVRLAWADSLEEA